MSSGSQGKERDLKQTKESSNNVTTQELSPVTSGKLYIEYVIRIGQSPSVSTCDDASIFSFFKKVHISHKRRISDRYSSMRLVSEVKGDKRSMYNFPRAKYIPCISPSRPVYVAKLIFHPLYIPYLVPAKRISHFSKCNTGLIPSVTSSVFTSRFPPSAYKQKYMQG